MLNCPQEAAQDLSRVIVGTGQKWVWPLVTLDPNQMVSIKIKPSSHHILNSARDMLCFHLVASNC